MFHTTEGSSGDACRASAETGDGAAAEAGYGRLMTAVTGTDLAEPTGMVPDDDGRGRVRRAFGGTKALVRIVYRDPEHVPERLMLHATQNLAESSRAWAE